MYSKIQYYIYIYLPPYLHTHAHTHVYNTMTILRKNLNSTLFLRKFIIRIISLQKKGIFLYRVCFVLLLAAKLFIKWSVRKKKKKRQWPKKIGLLPISSTVPVSQHKFLLLAFKHLDRGAKICNRLSQKHLAKPENWEMHSGYWIPFHLAALTPPIP